MGRGATRHPSKVFTADCLLASLSVEVPMVASLNAFRSILPVTSSIYFISFIKGNVLCLKKLKKMIYLPLPFCAEHIYIKPGNQYRNVMLELMIRLLNLKLCYLEVLLCYQMITFVISFSFFAFFSVCRVKCDEYNVQRSI